VAGTIAITKEDRWSVSNWAYHWVLDFLIHKVTDPKLAAALREIDDLNLGWVDLDDFDKPQCEELLDLLANELVPDAEARLVPEKASRDEWIDVIRPLQEIARNQIDARN
jgi:hypothetical protein